MESNEDNWTCAHCGYMASGRFTGDICPNCGLTFWKCANCGYTVTAGVPPEECPECGHRDGFLNVTCYIPECGGPGHIDERLARKQNML